MTIEEKQSKYLALLHAMQTGVGFKLQKDASEADPKQVRTGINSALVSHGALVALLVNKGLITLDEYYDSLIEALEREVKMYEEQLSKQYGGASITLH